MVLSTSSHHARPFSACLTQGSLCSKLEKSVLGKVLKLAVVKLKQNHPPYMAYPHCLVLYQDCLHVSIPENTMFSLLFLKGIVGSHCYGKEGERIRLVCY